MTHGVFLRSQGQTQYAATARALAQGDLDGAGLSEAEHALLAYAAKLTRTPAAMTDADVAALHAHGWSDAEVWEATFTTSIFAMFNRMADAFGLEPPEHLVAQLER